MKNLRIAIIITILILAASFLVWQKAIDVQTLSCGGDWSYKTNCPFGTTCKSLGQGSFAGGICTPWIELK